MFILQMLAWKDKAVKGDTNEQHVCTIQLVMKYNLTKQERDINRNQNSFWKEKGERVMQLGHSFNPKCSFKSICALVITEFWELKKKGYPSQKALRDGFLLQFWKKIVEKLPCSGTGEDYILLAWQKWCTESCLMQPILIKKEHHYQIVTPKKYGDLLDRF